MVSLYLWLAFLHWLPAYSPIMGCCISLESFLVLIMFLTTISNHESTWENAWYDSHFNCRRNHHPTHQYKLSCSHKPLDYWLPSWCCLTKYFMEYRLPNWFCFSHKEIHRPTNKVEPFDLIQITAWVSMK